MFEPIMDDQLCSAVNEYVSISSDGSVLFRRKAIILIFIYVLSAQGSVESAATSAALKSWSLTSRASSDVLRFGESRDRIRALEKDVMALKGQLTVAKSKEKSATDAESFILDCLNATNQELESKICFFSFLLCLL